MGIFLMILKIIGITLAVLVGLILLIVMLVLFVPIRYKGNGEYPYTGNKLPADVHACISWLLHIVHITFDTTANGQILKAKVFGFTIINNDPEVVKKKEEKRKKKEEKLRKKREKKEAKLQKIRKKKEEKERNLKEKAEAKRRQMMDSQKQKQDDIQDKEFKKWSKEHKNIGESDNDSLGSLEDAYFDSSAVEKSKEEVSKDTLKETNHKKSEIYDETLKIFDDEDDKSDDSTQEEDLKSKEKQSIFEKISAKIKGIVEIPKKLYNKVVNTTEKVTTYKDFIEEKRVQAGIKFALSKVKIIIKRILPTKVTGHAVIGMDNPATTGYIFGGVCMFYGAWARHFEFTPDFTQKRIEADVKLKGKIRLISLLIPGLKILLNKDIKYIRYKLGKIKKETSSEDT